MNRHHFISYSSADAQGFALRLCDELTQGPPPIPVWLDKRELVAGGDWDDQIVEAIRDCASVIFVMTRDSVRPQSVCKKEWTRALKYKKPIIPILLHPDAEMPFSLEPRQHIDFTGAFDPALARLRNDLQHLSSPAGLLQQMKDRLADAQRDLPRTADVTKKARIQDDIAQIERQIADQRKIVDDPEGAARRVQESIERGLEYERKPERPSAGVARGKFINPPPGVAPFYFQDRHIETKLVVEFLNDESLRMMTIVGRGGVGKTALVCRLLKSLERGQLPDDLGPMSVDGVVYLSATGSRRVNFPNIFADLCKLLADDVASRLDALYKNPQAPTEAKMRAVLEALPAGRIVLLLDSFEDMVDPETSGLRDAELGEALRALLNAHDHAVKAIVTSRITPRDLMLLQPGRQRRLHLDEGLESPFAENILRDMDTDGKLGLRSASAELLNEARKRLRGHPRALEALFAILSADRDTSLQEVLNDTEKLLPEHVVEALVGEVFSRLDPTAQQVLQALAIYGRPVTPAATDYLLQPHLPGVNSAPVLSRLVNMQFARKDAGHYHLDPVDRAYALSRVPVGDKSDRDNTEATPYTQFALLHRGVEYFKQSRTPSENWKSIEDLAPQLAEFDLRCEGHDYDTAADVLVEIDEYLFRWGHYTLVIELHSRLQGKLSDLSQRLTSAAKLNRAYRMMGRLGVNIIHTLRGHKNPVTRMAWLTDGQALISGSLDGTIRLWDVKSGTEQFTLHGHLQPVFAVAVTPDGTRAISASGDKTLKVWDLKARIVTRTLVGHTDIVTAVAVMPDERRIISASWDRSLKIWDLETGQEIHTFTGHTDRINAVAVTPDGRRAISASWDSTLKVWDLETKQEMRALSGHTGGVNEIAVLREGQILASASEDCTIRLWNLHTGLSTKVLEGHTAYVTCISSSSDGRLLASKAADGRVRLWDCDKWETVAILSESSPSNSVFAGMAFAPQKGILASLGEEDMVVRIWSLDLDDLLGAAASEKAIQYATVKIALVGDSGVGKTGLGWRIVHNKFKEQSSSHGQQFWVADSLRTVRPDKTECEVVLWDFAGQPDYRLIHALFLEDVDLALVLFDPTERDEELKAARYWLKHLTYRQGGGARTILIGARIDRGTSILTPQELETFCQRYGVSGGYISASAYTGVGVAELTTRIKAQVDWEEKTPTVTTKAFNTIKDCVLSLRKSAAVGQKDGQERQIPLLLSPEQLSEQLILWKPDSELKFNYDELMTAVGHLAKHGFVSLLRRSSGEQFILLAPDLLNNLAASFVLEARRNNFGLLNEGRLLRGEYRFQELANLDAQAQEILIDAATILFLKHNLCFRKTIKTDSFLVFPALINQKRPLSEEIEIVEDISYNVSGSVETVYPTLVVRLGLTDIFTRTNQWQNQAQYETGRDEVCGFRQIEKREGEIELILYYGLKTPSHTRQIFQGLFEMFLNEHGVTVEKYPPVICPNCGVRQERSMVVRRTQEGKEFVGCEECLQKIVLPKASKDVVANPAQSETLNQEQSRTRLQTMFAEALVAIKRMINNRDAQTTPRCFISYAWGVLEYENWVLRLALNLRDAGIAVVLDKWENPVGANISRFIGLIKECDFTLVIGTPLYREKYENEVSPGGSVVAAECDLINSKLLGSETSKRTVLPLLLDGDPENSFPPLLHGRVHIDFRQDSEYFACLFKLIFRLYGLNLDDRAVSDLWASLLEGAKKAGALIRF